MVAQICEIVMLVAFGFSWPFNISKSWKSKTAKGKSIGFEFLVIFGYLVGVYGKYWTWQQTGVLAYSTWFYLVDILMVTTDLLLTFRNIGLDKLRDRKARKEAEEEEE